MWETLRNAWKIADLRKKILYTLFMLLIYRLLCFVPTPGVNVEVVSKAVAGISLLDFMNTMTGSNLEQFTIMAMGITPYINASIIMQLLCVAIPKLEELQKEGEEGRKKIAQITRYVTIVLGFIQAVALSIGLGAAATTAWYNYVTIGLCLAGGTALAMWIGERINDKGIGNGVSLLIFVGIISRWSSLINSVKGLLAEAADGKPQYYVFIPLIAILAIAAVVFVVILTNGERRIPVQYAKRVVGRKMYGGQASHIPIKVNMSGVMPVIFASTLCSIPNMIGSLLQVKSSFWVAFFDVFNYNSVLYAVIYLLLILAFNYFYVAIQYNPVEIANNLRKNNGAIPGIRPGKPTSDFITKSLSKITLIGAVFLGIIAVLPIVLGNVTGVSIQLGGTSLLIVVGVALDTGRSMESYMLMRHPKGFLE